MASDVSAWWKEGPGYTIPGPLLPESRYFEPSERCAHPERWHSTDGWSAEAEVSELLGAFVRALQPDLVVETGAAFGGTSARLADAIARNGHGRLVALELDPERALQANRAIKIALDGRPARCEVLVQSSLEWLPDEQIGLLFCDTERELRVPEIVRYRTFLHPGSIIAIHDTGAERGPLRASLEATFVTSGQMHAIDLPTPRGLTLLECL